MSRNKTAKHNAKRALVKNTIASTDKMEKDIASVPAKLAAQLNKEITSLKQKENKLKTAHNKIKTDVKNWETRIKAASKAQKSAAAKKRLNAAKKAYTQANKTQDGVSKELQQTVQTLETLLNKQAKFTALSKLLNQFEKEWARNSKKASAANKAKAKKKKSAKKSKVAKTPAVPVTIPAEQPHFESVETMTAGNEISSSEATEMA